MAQDNNLIPPHLDPESEPDAPEQSRSELPQILEIKYEAPLPPPHMVRQFEEILPGAADRIFTLMEEQSHHRHGLENTKLHADIASERRGQIIGASLAFVAMVAGFVLIYKGKSIPGTIVFISTCASLIGIFIAGKLTQKRERQERLEELIRAILRSLHSEEHSGEPPEDEE